MSNYLKIFLLFAVFTWIEAYSNFRPPSWHRCDENESWVTNGCQCDPGYVKNEQNQCVKVEENQNSGVEPMKPLMRNAPVDGKINYRDDSFKFDPNDPETKKLLTEVFGTPEDWSARKNKVSPYLKKEVKKIFGTPSDSGYVNYRTDFDPSDPETLKALEEIFGPKKEEKFDPEDPEVKKKLVDIFGKPPNYRMDIDVTQN